MNPANVITVARVLLVPVFLWAAYRGLEASAGLALTVFAVASLSDLVDGYLARRFDMVTRLGQFLDPTADKLLVASALVVLVDLRRFPLWAALLIAAREVAVQILRTRIVQRGNDLPASAAGKLKTVLQVAMVSVWLLEPRVGILHWALLVVVIGATFVSAWSYFRHAAVTSAAVDPA